MESFAQVLNIPILQALGVIILIGIAERMGIPVVSTIKQVLKLENGNTQDDRRKGESTLGAVVERMTKLEKYFNHDTTEKLDRLISMEEKEHESAQETRDVQRETLWLLRDLKENGIKCKP